MGNSTKKVWIYVFLSLSFISVILSVLIFFDIVFTHIAIKEFEEFTQAAWIALAAIIILALFALIFVYVLIRISRSLQSNGNDQALIDFQYKCRGKSLLILCLGGIPSLLIGVIAFLIGAFTNEGVYFFYIVIGFILIMIYGISYFFLPNNEDYCESCHKKIDIGWTVVSRNTDTQRKKKHYMGGSRKVGHISDDKGNSADIYEDYDGFDVEVTREVTTTRESRACPHCGHVHNKTTTNATKWG